jgi:hypothetical protein
MRGQIRVTLFAALIVSCQPAGEEKKPEETARPSYTLDAVPDSLQPYVDQADRASQALQAGLLERLTTELGRGGPAAAVQVCRDEAQAITARVSSTEGVALGRTSHRLRNSGNSPRPWVRPYLDAAAGKKAEEVPARVVDLEDRVGLLRPIGVLGMCIPCHGSAEEISSEVNTILESAYPEDQAVGFAIGDFRGFLWAEVAKRN